MTPVYTLPDGTVPNAFYIDIHNVQGKIVTEWVEWAYGINTTHFMSAYAMNATLLENAAVIIVTPQSAGILALQIARGKIPNPKANMYIIDEQVFPL